MVINDRERCTCRRDGTANCARHSLSAEENRAGPRGAIPKSLLPMILGMKHNAVEDYVIPGLTSSLIGTKAGHGCVRIFEQSRHHEEPITPHSHRFDFCCLVLKGWVRNRVWVEDPDNNDADVYRPLRLNHHGSFGSYDILSVDEDQTSYSFKETLYNEGMWYSMTADQYHSIYFSKGAVVLFIEGPNINTFSHVLEPLSGDRVIPTFKVEPWMFRREGL